MAVSEADVRHVAGLARLGLSDARVQALAGELNSILAHMDALGRVHTDALPIDGVAAGGMPLRTDAGPPYPLARTIESFAPRVDHDFILVPRLATHGAPVEEGA